MKVLRWVAAFGEALSAIVLLLGFILLHFFEYGVAPQLVILVVGLSICADSVRHFAHWESWTCSLAAGLLVTTLGLLDLRSQSGLLEYSFPVIVIVTGVVLLYEAYLLHPKKVAASRFGLRG